MRLLLIAALLCPVVACLSAPQRGQNLLANPDFESADATRAPSWGPAGAGYALSDTTAQSGKRALVCEAGDDTHYFGAMQEVTLDPPVQHPFRVTGWSKAEDAHGADYCLYMDCWYADGTNLWGQRGDFEAGTHDWQPVEYVFVPAKPVTKIQFFILFRHCRGRAWFDNVSLSLAPFEVQHQTLTPGAFGGNSIDYTARLSFPAEWTVTVLAGGQAVHEVSGSGPAASMAWDGRDAAGKLLPGGDYGVRLSARDALRGEALVKETTTHTPPGEGRGYAAWVASSMQRVLINSLPTRAPAPLEASIALARNEYESFQLAVRAAPGRELTGGRVQCSALRGPGGALIPADRITWHQVGFVELKDLFRHPRLPEEAVPGWWPDPLLPVSEFTIPGATTQALWFTVYAPPATPAGDYRGEVTVTFANAPTMRVAVGAVVYGFAVPTQPHLKTAFALMDGYLEKLYGPLTPELRRAYGDYVLQRRLNPDDISRTDPPAIEDLAYYDGRGLNAFNVVNMVRPRGKQTWVCWSPLEVYTPDFKLDLIRRLDPYVAELKRRGLLAKAYVYTFDERGEEFNAVMREYFGLIKTRYAIPTLTTAKVAQTPAAMRDLNIDWNCPVSSVYKFAQAEQCRREGLQVWSYVCCGPRYPYANWLADDPLIEARVIWWQAYQQKMDGFLYWGLNIWGRANNNYLIDPEHDGPRLKWSITTGGEDWARLHGDGELLYPGKHGPLGSIRLDNIRDGIEDYEYLWLLAQLTGDVEQGRTACLPVTSSLTTFTRDEQVVSAQRERIARRIEALARK